MTAKTLVSLHLLVWLVLALTLSGCAGQPTLLPATQPTETAAALSQAPVQPATATPTALLASPPVPTKTPGAPQPGQTPDLSVYKRQAWAARSPDEGWSANVVVSYPENADGTLFGDQYHTLVIAVNLKDGTQWRVVDEWLNYGLGYTTPEVLGWSDDGRFLYIGDSGVPDGCGPRFTQNLRRVHLSSGHVSPLEIDTGRSPALSPDGQTLVSFGEEGLLLHDLENGEEAAIAFEPPAQDWWPGSVSFSPEGEQLLFTLWLNACGGPDEISSSIILVDLAGQSARPLIESDPRRYSIQSWPEEAAVLLRDQVDGSWWLAVGSGEISAAPPQDVAEAQNALLRYFEALHAGRYAEASQLYGGSYETLTGQNPDLDPDDYAGLWQNACQVNGFQCLQVSNVFLLRKLPDEFHFRATFMNPDGSLFRRGPCCGADIADMPPEWEFDFTVVRDASGKYLVQDLPVYVP